MFNTLATLSHRTKSTLQAFKYLSVEKLFNLIEIVSPLNQSKELGKNSLNSSIKFNNHEST